MQRFAVTVHRGTPTGAVVADLTRYATRCRWSFNRHGAADLEVTAPRRFVEAMRLYQMSGLLWVVVSQGARRVWVGRLAAPELWAGDDGSGITLRALGRWAALGDLPYTSLWSTTQVNQWSPAAASLGGILTNTVPDRFQIDTNNRLYIAPKKNEVFGNTAFGGVAAVGALYMLRPASSVRSVEYVSFSFAVAGTTWEADMIRLNDDLSYAGSIIWSQAGTGSSTFSGAITACGGLAFRFYYNAANATYTGESGAVYARLTNLRINGDAAATVVASTVAGNVAAQVNGLNSTLISATTLLSNPGYDFTDLAFEDADPRDVLNLVAERGTGTGTVYDVGVDLDGHLFLHPAGTNAREWLIDVADISVVSERETLVNSVYAVYEDASGRPLRTAASANAASVGLAGYTRRVAVGVRTTSATRAGEWRDQALADGATVRPSGRYRLRRVLTAYGALADPSEVRPGDTLTVRNLPLAAGAGGEVDRVRTFRLSETEYDPIADELTVTPETPQPRLEVLIAQGAI